MRRNDVWLTRQQLVGLGVVALVVLLLTIMGTAVVVTVWMGADASSGDEGERVSTNLPTLPTRPSPTALPPAQIVDALGWYQLDVAETALPTTAPTSPTPTTVYLDTEVDFTPAESPLSGWPVGGQMTQGFGCTEAFTEIPGAGCPDEAPWFHGGVDIGAAEGAPVRAAMAGTVVFAGADPTGPECGGYRGYGLTIMLDNREGWETLYAHLSQIDVEAGQRVTPETIIGAVGQTGCATGPHLHFGLRYQGTLLDAGLHMPEDVYR